MENNCLDLQKYLFIIRQILDNEASPEDEAALNDHLSSCTCCLHEYELEQQVRCMIKAKSEKRELPADLENSIRKKILQSNLNVN